MRILACIPLLFALAAAATEPEAFRGRVAPISDQRWAKMEGVVWTEGCPVPRDELRVLEVSHRNFRGRVSQGALVVAAAEAERLLQVFERLFEAGFPIERMEPVENYGGDDDASMAANNTSAFNCRKVAGTKSYSRHSWGTAIDLNPVQNPYVRGQRVEPPAGRKYLDRTDVRPGMIVEGDVVVRAFEAIGWKWGGRWKTARDYQHFSVDGR